MDNQNESESWMGQRGFDEAKYYRDEKSEIGLNYSDVKIQEEAREALSRNELLSGSKIEVKVLEGVLELHGSVETKGLIKEAQDSVCFITGVKSVENYLSSLK